MSDEELEASIRESVAEVMRRASAPLTEVHNAPMRRIDVGSCRHSW